MTPLPRTARESQPESMIRLDLHCHSIASDAALAPEKVADGLARAGVGVAALTDHDTIDGLDAFRRRLARRGVGFIAGVEITAEYRGRELHLLAYGFDVSHRELRTALHAIRRGQAGGARSLAESGADTVPRGRLDVVEAIALLHRAGGKAFLAHPLALACGAVLREWLVQLKAIGLDGVEAFYGPYTREERGDLARMAGELDLLVSGGSDWHGKHGDSQPGVDMPEALWRAFRAEVCFNGLGVPLPARHADPPRDWLRFGVRIVLPVVLAMVLLVAAVFAVLLPAVENSLLDRKRELIRELTRSACSILEDCEQQVRSGKMTRPEAQELARQRIRVLRYGSDGKDYFWVQDLTPRMIMHPYRADLEGQDLSGYRDPRGNPIFVEFAARVRAEKQGYVRYVWQWQDDATRQSPKESYVQGFAPWGWVVGTGMYVDDVRTELAGIRRKLVRICAGVAGLVGVVLAYLLLQGVRAERKRSDAEEALRESNERYRLLIEASTEGTLLVENGRCCYANPTFRSLVGYPEAEIELLGMDDVLPAEWVSNKAARTAIGELRGGREPFTGCEGTLRRRDESGIDCVLSFSRLPGRPGGFILMARRVAPQPAIARPHPGDESRDDWRVWLGGGVLRPGTTPRDLVAEAGSAPSAEDVAGICRNVPRVISGMLEAGARSWHVTNLVSDVHDAAVRRLVDLALRELGAPPAPFAFLALGSFGRSEATLAADQDNAIVYDGPEGDSGVADYFAALGARICNGLQAAGYPSCRGQTLAANRRWCQPVTVWQRYFSDWIRTGAERELMECSIFFDFRPVSGDNAIAAELWKHIQAELQVCPAFVPRFAAHSVQFKPPIRLFGHTLGGGGESPGTLNLKDALMPVVGFARLYAIHRGIGMTGTRDRLDGLVPSTISPVIRADIDLVWDFLMRLRLVHQVQQQNEGIVPDNSVPDRELPPMEQAMLDRAFHRLTSLQKMISHDFLGDA